MNKKELAVAISQKCDLSASQSSAALDATLDCITSSLKQNEEVRLLGFGNFVSVRREARTARNPQTGATIDVAAANVPKFKPGKALKDAVNN